jgi:hypothetical protein
MSRAADWYDPDTADIEQVAEWIADWTFNGVATRGLMACNIPLGLGAAVRHCALLVCSITSA